MVRLLRRYYWVILAPAYWLFSVWLLGRVFRISVDGSGPSATFFWGDRVPTPTLAEYQQSLSVQLHFLGPYLVAAAIVTVVGCGLSSKVVTFLHPRNSRLFLTLLATCFFCLLGVAGLSDIGTVLRLWRGPMMYGTVSSFVMILEVAVPLSVLAGLLIFARRYPSEPRVD
jgi:hypothetical protein